uniref:Uncharacterized protein n=1 Tax=Myripristis murdjan TaxID=586833 RepID=A0A668AH38_9TELE
DEIRRKTGDKREMLRSHVKPRPELDDSPCDLNQIYDDLRALEKENWISLSPDNTWRTNSTGIDSHRDKLHIPESSLISGGKCHSPCALMDRKCSSPSIVRKFEAMLQKNEGKILTDGVIASCSVPANSNCNVGCCHSRWSCDVSKFSSNKPGVGNLKSPEGHEMPPVVRELPVDLLLPSLEIPSACPSLQGSRRNIVLEKKTAEFNRTLFQAEMGRGVEEQDNFTTVSPVFCKPVCPTTSVSDEVTPPREANFDVRPQCAEVTSGIVSAHPEVTLSPSILDPPTKSKLMTQPGHQTQPRHPSVTSSQSDTPRPGPRVMNDHPWKPLTLAAYPRPEGSRSNYGAVERILKSYESAAWAQENQNQQNEMPSILSPKIK